jgi:uncharacterized sulfatase
MQRLPLLALLVLALPLAAARAQEAPPRPNVLWITCEDISPHLGCYGDRFAVTPNLDRLAAQGVRYTHAFTVIGVCAPSRSCLITGMYPTALGSHHMRCQARLPDEVKCFPEYLRHAGYYCSNNVKTDYNFPVPKNAWDESSNKAHWRNRKPGQPFFSVFNLVVSHESQIRTPEATFLKQTARLTKEERHDPAQVTVPPYHPDTPVVRRDWARYYDLITAMDKQAGDLLKQLEDDGLAEDTIVFFFSDHGAGLPRCKRWLYDSSLRVPFLVRFPAKYQRLAPAKPGSAVDRLISFVDVGPTVLSLCGVKLPAHLHGQPFLGGQAAAPREYVYGFRDRMDERVDFIRCVRDRRYKYIRNFLPHLPYAQDISYMNEMPTMQEYRRLAAAGKLEGPAALFMRPTKPVEELYDCEADPHEVRNLADSPAHREVLERLRRACLQWMKETRDLGPLPEVEIHRRSGKTPPYEMARKGDAVYPQQRILDAAMLAAQGPDALPKLVELFKDKDPAVRYWGAVGCSALGAKAAPATETLRQALADPSPVVRMAAADALCRLDRHAEALPVLIEALKHDNEWVRHSAALVLDSIGPKAKPALAAMKARLDDSNQYVVRVLGPAVKRLEQ